MLPESVRDAHQLVIVCNLPLPRRAQLTRLRRRLGIRATRPGAHRIRPRRELAALYRGCELFIFPSLYEGAGLPVLEAMSCGAPVAASSTSSIPEILGDLEATFDPADPADIARCIARCSRSPVELDCASRALARDGVALFTWERVAERTLEGYERALRTPRPPRRRPVMARSAP